MTPDEIITKKDLEAFKQELFALLGANKPAELTWMKNADVRAMLGMANAKLQTLRVNGSLPFSKIGGTYFYKRADVEAMLENAQKKSPKVRSK